MPPVSTSNPRRCVSLPEPIPETQTGKRPRRWLSRAVFGLAVLGMLLGIRLYQHRDLPRDVAPPLAGRLLDGASVSLAGLRGKPVLVHFWASWCPICALEEGSIDAIAADHRVVTVAMQSGDAKEVAAHLRERHLDFPVLNDPDGRYAAAWGVRGVPASFVLGPDGRIRFTEVGYTTETGLRLRLWLAAH